MNLWVEALDENWHLALEHAKITRCGIHLDAGTLVEVGQCRQTAPTCIVKGREVLVANVCRDCLSEFEAGS